MKSIFKRILFFTLILFFSQANAQALEKVSLQLSWKHQFEFAGYYAAKHKGYYEQAGLDVSFKEMSFEAKDSVFKDVLQGRSTYAIDYSSIVKEYLDGKPIVFVANFLKHSPLVLATQKEIKLPSDIQGKRFMGGKDALNNTSMLLMFKKFGINEKSFIDVAQTFSMDDFKNKKVDATTIFLTNQAYDLDKMGYEYNILHPEKYGAEFYVDNLFTSKKELDDNPHRVKAFKEATIKGWHYALEHKDEIIELILKQYNTQNKSKEQYMFEAKQLESLMLASIYPLGSIDEKRVKRIAESYVELGLVNKQPHMDFSNFIFQSGSSHLQISKKEQIYLQSKNEIKLCVDPNWMPYESIDDQGRHVGLSSDYFKIFEQHLPIAIKLVQTNYWSQTLEYFKSKKCDIISLAASTPSRKEYMNFTSPYLQIPFVLATRPQISFIDDLLRLKKVKVGVSKGHAFRELFAQNYPSFEIIEVTDSDEGLQKVINGELFGFIGTLATVGYKFQNKYTGELKIAAKFDERLTLGVAVQKDDPILLGIFEKLVQSVDKYTQQEILNQHISISYESRTDYLFLVKVMFGLFVILLVFIYWNRRLSIEKKNTQNALNRLRKAEQKLALKNDELKVISITDKLTGIYNRAKIDKKLQDELNRSARTNDEFSVIMMDIDHFKNVNDTYGHQVGDIALIEITKCLKKNIRKVDILGRWGGEEFIIICPHTSMEGAVNKAERLRMSIEIEEFTELGHLTASFGVASYKEGDTIHAIMNRSDKALYSAKHQGRNRVVEKR